MKNKIMERNKTFPATSLFAQVSAYNLQRKCTISLLPSDTMQKYLQAYISEFHLYITEKIEIKCEQDSFYSSVPRDESCQGLLSDAFGSARV